MATMLHNAIAKAKAAFSGKPATAPNPIRDTALAQESHDFEASWVPYTPAQAQAIISKGVGKHFVVYTDSDNGNDIGVPDPSELQGYTHMIMAFWVSNGGPADNVRKWANATPAARAAMHNKYKAAGIKLMVSAFGATDAPQSNGYTAQNIADRLSGFVKDFELDGVDIDYEEFDTMAQGKSLQWLIDLTTILRTNLPSPTYVITHAPVAPWLSKVCYPKDGAYAGLMSKVGDKIDFLNVQFYNQQTYGTLDSLLWDSGTTYPQSSLFEIIRYSGIDKSKIVVGKPTRSVDADPAGDGYMEPSVLGTVLKTAVANGFTTGVMYYEFPWATSNRMLVVRDNSGL